MAYKSAQEIKGIHKNYLKGGIQRGKKEQITEVSKKKGQHGRLKLNCVNSYIKNKWFNQLQLKDRNIKIEFRK